MEVKDVLYQKVTVSAAEGSIGTGMKCTAFDSWSNTVRMVVWPADRGSPGTK